MSVTYTTSRTASRNVVLSDSAISFMFKNACRHPRFLALDQGVGLGVNAAHSCDVDEIARARSEVPGASRLDRSRRRQCLDPTWRNLLGGGGTDNGHHDPGEKRQSVQLPLPG